MSVPEMRTLLLEYRSGQRDGEVAHVILANIPGQRYTFGTLNPGVREGEKFLLCRGFDGGIVGPTHCTIRVDDQGQYWIQDYTINPYEKRTFSFYETFVNSMRVEASESRLLKSGDIISLGAPGTDWAGSGHAPHPIYRVKLIQEGMIPSYSPQININENEDGPKEVALAESPFDNGLILSEIMTYLSVPDLKSARLVNKLWNGEASTLLKKKAQVSFDFHFGSASVNPQNSTKVSRYLQEMEGLKVENLLIRLEPFEGPSLVQNPPWDKMMSDLRELLNSTHNFSSLSINSWTIGESDFPALVLILQELGGKLVELELIGDIDHLPKHLPSFPVMSNLRKFTREAHVEKDTIRMKWDAHLVPLFTQSLELFRCIRYDRAGETYLQEFLKHELPKLRGVEIQDGISEDVLSALLQLKTPLTFLKIWCYYTKERSSDLLEKLLFKNSSSLQHLSIKISPEKMCQMIQVKFPSFPKLEELKLNYMAAPSNMRITWESESGDLEYKKHLPSLRRLSVVNWFRNWESDYADEDDPVFNSFFKEGGAVSERREGVKKVRLLDVKAQPRMDKIKETFPNAVLSLVPGDDHEGESSDEEFFY